MNNNSDQITASLKKEGIDEEQQLVGGNYPWGQESDLESETKKEMDPAVSTAISEVLSKIEKGPIHLEEQLPHPYFKPTLKTLYAKRANQVVVEANVIIHHHLVDSISEQVRKGLCERKHTLQTPFKVIFEETGKVGAVKEYRFKQAKPNSGSISATLECIIEWNDEL